MAAGIARFERGGRTRLFSLVLLSTFPPVLGACGDAERPSLVEAGSPFVAEPEQPADEADGDEEIVLVRVNPPPRTDLLGDVVVTLEDVSLMDIDAPVLAETIVTADELNRLDGVVQIPLPIPRDAADISVAVHVDVDESGSLSPGDLISPMLQPLDANEGDEVVVDVVPI